MKQYIQKVRKVLLDNDILCVNDYHVEVDLKRSTPKLAAFIATNKYTKDVQFVKLTKFDITQLESLDTLKVVNSYANITQALSELNERYSLNIVPDEIVHTAFVENKAKLSFKDDSLGYFGSIDVVIESDKMDLIGYFDNQTTVLEKETEVNSTPMMLRHLTFTYMFDSLKTLMIGDNVPEEVAKLLLCRLSPMKFHVTKEKSYRNLRGAVVISNEKITTPFTKATRVLKIGLNVRLCDGLKGILEIYY